MLRERCKEEEINSWILMGGKKKETRESALKREL